MVWIIQTWQPNCCWAALNQHWCRCPAATGFSVSSAAEPQRASLSNYCEVGPAPSQPRQDQMTGLALPSVTPGQAEAAQIVTLVWLRRHSGASAAPAAQTSRWGCSDGANAQLGFRTIWDKRVTVLFTSQSGRWLHTPDWLELLIHLTFMVFMNTWTWWASSFTASLYEPLLQY